MRIVDLDLGPEVFGDVILERDVSDDRNADRIFVVQRDGNADGCLDIEIAPALARRECWRDDPSIVCKWHRAGRRREAKEGCDDIVAVLLVGTEKTLLDGDRLLVAPPVCRLDDSAIVMRRQVDENLISHRRDELKAFAAVIDSDVGTRVGVLKELIIPELLLEPRGDGCQRGAVTLSSFTAETQLLSYVWHSCFQRLSHSDEHENRPTFV